jgi:hypothetical protein
MIIYVLGVYSYIAIYHAIEHVRPIWSLCSSDLRRYADTQRRV